MVKITNEIHASDEVLYLIFAANIIFWIKLIEQEAILSIDSICTSEVIRLSEATDGLKVFRQDINGGREVLISVQETGMLYNGALTKVLKMNFVPISRIIYSSPRMTLPDNENDYTELNDEELPSIKLQNLASVLKKKEDNEVQEDKPLDTWEIWPV